MDYKIRDVKQPFEGRISKYHGSRQYTITINGNQHSLSIISITPKGVEFILDQKYHRAKYLERTTNEISLVIDNVVMTLNMHTHLDEIVYKNSGGGGGGGNVQSGLKSQIPGKVVSIAVSEGDSVMKGDIVCTLESMKMQVAVKAHKDGTVKALKIKETATVAKGDIIADIE